MLRRPCDRAWHWALKVQASSRMLLLRGMDRLTNSLDSNGPADGRDGLPTLTSRQRQVAAHVAAGLSNKEIAGRLVITEGTIANHIEAILKRLQLRNRVQVAVWAARHGLPESHQESVTPADT